MSSAEKADAFASLINVTLLVGEGSVCLSVSVLLVTENFDSTLFLSEIECSNIGNFPFSLVVMKLLITVSERLRR